MLKKVFPLIAIVLLMAACNCSKGTQSTETPTSFIFGSGGGFTGQYVEYQMHSNGKIEQKNFSNGAFEPYAEVKGTEVEAFFTELNQLQLQLQNFTFSHPGNMTWYIEVSNDGTTNRVKWGDSKNPIKPEIESFFNKVNGYVLKLKQ